MLLLPRRSPQRHFAEELFESRLLEGVLFRTGYLFFNQRTTNTTVIELLNQFRRKFSSHQKEKHNLENFGKDSKWTAPLNYDPKRDSHRQTNGYSIYPTQILTHRNLTQQNAERRTFLTVQRKRQKERRRTKQNRSHLKIYYPLTARLWKRQARLYLLRLLMVSIFRSNPELILIYK